MSRLAILLGSGNAAFAIVLSAYSAHALRPAWPEYRYSIFQIAVDYHLYHALGLVVIGILIAQHSDRGLLRIAAAVMLAGIILFCGSLYFLSLTELAWSGRITPFGGVAFIISWVLVMTAYLRKN
ncbi:MAG: DUF423 domain-containing protein [Gammaproteobacteria bacterium]|nr:DUF423 domain-containing protein [Gammaproteobacteria bacterium]